VSYLGFNQYGKAEIRVVRVLRPGAGAPGRQDVVLDDTVGVALSGDLAASHLDGDNSGVLPTDTMKNTVNAFARDDDAVAQPESFGLKLARHFVDSTESIARARVSVARRGWRRLTVGGAPSPSNFALDTGAGERTATVTVSPDGTWVVSGVRGLTVLKSAGSEFHGFLVDDYTTLAPTNDRILATAVAAQWWHAPGAENGADWGGAYDNAVAAMLEAFAAHHSLALQQTLYAMGEAVLAAEPGLAEIRLSLPNKHHFLVDLAPFGLDNANLVFHADDRPYGLIEGTVRREGAPDPGPAFDPGQGW
jgi:urate oxidase